MDTAYRMFLNHVEKSLQFEYQDGAVSTVTYPHRVGWRTVPSLVTAHVTGYSATIERKGFDAVIVKQHETLCVSPGALHRVEMITRGPGISRWSHVRFHILGGMDIFTVLEPSPIIKGRDAKRIGHFNIALDYLHKEPKQTLSTVLQKRSVATSLLLLVAEHSKMRPEALSILTHSSRISPVLEHIKEHFKKALSRESLANIAQLSPSRFDVVFKSIMGKPSMVYVHELRLLEAERLLLNSDLTVREIAFAVGHEDEFHFSRSFKHFFGASPRLYREKAKTRTV